MRTAVSQWLLRRRISAYEQAWDDHGDRCARCSIGVKCLISDGYQAALRIMRESLSTDPKGVS